MTDFTPIRAAALQLPPAERAALAEDLLASLNEKWEEEWGNEVLARSDAYHKGLIESHDGRESIARIQLRLA